VAIAAWRLSLAALLLAPLAGRDLVGLRRLSPGQWSLMLAAGATLALHFFAWITAVQWTTVANASMFFAINPVFTSAAAWFFYRERLTYRLGVSILLGLAGVAVMGWSDFSFNPGHLAGDAASLVCSVLFTVYFLIGKKLRQSLPNLAYVTVLYGVAGLVSFAVLAALGQPAFAYTGRTWLSFVLMALIPTMIGHTAINNALSHMEAGRIATATLVEPMLAGVVAFFAWGEIVSVGALAGYGLICLSVVALVSDRLPARTPVDGSA